MNSLRKNEKLLKSSFKTKVSLNEGTVVKFLVTGVIGFTLTACGGGGSSGDKNENWTSEDRVINENMQSSQYNKTLLTLDNVNGEIKENVTLKVTGDNSVAAHIKSGKKTFSRSIKNLKKLIHKGVINFSGNNSIGILSQGGTSGINLGVIKGVSSVKNKKNIYNVEEYGFFNKYYSEKENNFLMGMQSDLGGSVVNNNIIELKGKGAGIYVKNSSQGTNNGSINVESHDQKLKIETYNDGALVSIRDILYKDYIVGMFGKNNSVLLNDTTGKINVVGMGTGIEVKNNSKVENKGTINLTSVEMPHTTKVLDYLNEWITYSGKIWSDVYGIHASNDSLALNSGTININNNGVGIYVKGNSKGINTGEINLKGNGAFFGIIGLINESGTFKIENEGKITVEQAPNSVYTSYGIFAQGVKTESKGIVRNSGEINVIGNYGKGIFMINGQLLNTGKITLNGENTTALFLRNDTYTRDLNGINSGNILVTGNNGIGFQGVSCDINNSGEINVIGENSRGIEFFSHEKAQVENFGNILVCGNNSTGIDATSGNLINYKNIYVKGDDSFGVNSYNDRDSLDNVTFENEGVVEVSGENALGVRSFKGDIYNSGDILVSGNKSTGIYIYDGNLINSKNIYVKGDDSFGVNLYNDRDSLENITFENEGIVEVVGEYTWGIRSSKGDIYNSGNILVSGNDSTGIYIDQGNLINLNNIYVKGDNSIGVFLFKYFDILGNFKIENKGLIEVSGQNVIGVNASRTNIYNNGNISVFGDNSIGANIDSGDSINFKNIYMEGNDSFAVKLNIGFSSENLKFENKGNILAKGDRNKGVESYGIDIYNSGNIDVYGKGDSLEKLMGVFAQGKEIYISETGEIIQEKVQVENSGNINVTGEYSIGVKVYSGDFINSKSISVNGKDAVGVMLSKKYSTENIKFENEGDITVTAQGLFSSNKPTGVYSELGNVFNSGNIVVTHNDESPNEIIERGATGIFASYNNTVDNRGSISVTGKNSCGIYGHGSKNILNYGDITVKGENAFGIVLESGAVDSTGINYGNISVSGSGAVGMFAISGSTVINENSGVINVSSDALTGIKASGTGSTGINNGTINMAAGNTNDGMIAESGGVIINNGTINGKGNLSIGGKSGGAFVIGTDTKGNYGKISGENISLSGNILVSANITKNYFENEYLLQNIVDAENLTLEDNFTFNSTSLLYNAQSKEDIWGNLDATLTRNNKTLSHFANEKNLSLANIFGKYQNEQAFKNLDFDSKEVISSIDTESVQSINNSLNNLAPTIYSNLSRQIFNISETFKEESVENSKNLGLNTYNFSFLGKYEDIDSRKCIEGYHSKVSGFVGSIKLNENTFASIGYGYSDIDYEKNSKGSIETIHLNGNKFFNFKDTHLDFGFSGEYNFHKNTRSIENGSLSRVGKGNFNSYAIKGFGKISQNFGKDISLQPFFSLDLTYMNYQSFTESEGGSVSVNVDSENYMSILPKVGVTLSENIGNFNIFGNVEYSYDLGNLDKNQSFKYKGFSGRGTLPSDDLESSLTSLSFGGKYKINNFTIKGEVGKSFGKRDNTYGELSISYKF